MSRAFQCQAFLVAITIPRAVLAQSAPATEPVIIARFPGHAASAHPVAMSPNGKWVATGDVDRSSAVRLWDARDGRHLQRIEERGISLVGFLPSSHELLTCRADAVDVWDLRGEIRKTRSLPHPASISGISLSSDGKTVATGVARHTKHGSGGELRIWTLESWKEQELFEFPEAHFVQRITFNPQSTLVAAFEARTPGGLIHIIDVEKRRLVHTLPPGGGSTTAFSDELLVSTGLDEVHVWDVASWRKVKVLTPEEGDHWHVAEFTPDGKILAVGGFRRVFLWDATTWEPLPPLRGHTGYVTSLQFSADGKLLVSGAADDTALLWSLPDNLTDGAG